MATIVQCFIFHVSMNFATISSKIHNQLKKRNFCQEAHKQGKFGPRSSHKKKLPSLSSLHPSPHFLCEHAMLSLIFILLVLIKPHMCCLQFSSAIFMSNFHILIPFFIFSLWFSSFLVWMNTWKVKKNEKGATQCIVYFSRAVFMPLKSTLER